MGAFKVKMFHWKKMHSRLGPKPCAPNQEGREAAYLPCVSFDFRCNVFRNCSKTKFVSRRILHERITYYRRDSHPEGFRIKKCTMKFGKRITHGSDMFERGLMTVSCLSVGFWLYLRGLPHRFFFWWILTKFSRWSTP